MISERLKLIANTVTPGQRVADIGTDHAYVPIYLAKHNISDRILALDVIDGPLKIAKDNIRREGLEDKIEVRKSDGTKGINKGEVDALVIAGMGGDLIVRILDESEILGELSEMVLSPHRHTGDVRRKVMELGWSIVEESMIKDAGKFYNILKCKPVKEDFPYTDKEVLYGRCMIRDKSDVFIQFLDEEYGKLKKIEESIKQSSNPACEIENKIKTNRRVRRLCE